MIIRPKNWKSFQHYTDRKPAWVKLHRGLLDDYEFHCLPVASKALAPLLWLVASEHEEGEIDADYVKLGFRLRMKPSEVEAAPKPLIEATFFEVVQDASKTLASGEQSDGSEREKEREREKEGASARLGSSQKTPEGLNPQAWSEWQAYRKLKPQSIPAAQRKLAKLGDGQLAAVEHSIASGYKGVFPPPRLTLVAGASDADKTKRLEREARTLDELRTRAGRVQFRDFDPAKDDVVGYRTLLERFESNLPRRASS